MLDKLEPTLYTQSLKGVNMAVDPRLTPHEELLKRFTATIRQAVRMGYDDLALELAVLAKPTYDRVMALRFVEDFANMGNEIEWHANNDEISHGTR